jgi:release factor glutamine methyltransferase
MTVNPMTPPDAARTSGTPSGPGTPVQPGTATGWDLHAQLPHTLPPEEIRAINSPSRAIHDHRGYR